MSRMRQSFGYIGIFLAGMAFAPSFVIAQTTPAKVGSQAASSAATPSATEPLQITLSRSKITIVDGKESRQDASVAKPGDVLEETATYVNTSSQTLKGLEATLPVPVNTELIVASITPGNAKASTDGKSFAAVPLKRKVKQPNGVEVERPVPLAEYRYLRWYPGELSAQKSLVFSARFKVASDAVPATAAGQK